MNWVGEINTQTLRPVFWSLARTPKLGTAGVWNASASAVSVETGRFLGLMEKSRPISGFSLTERPCLKNQDGEWLRTPDICLWHSCAHVHTCTLSQHDHTHLTHTKMNWSLNPHSYECEPLWEKSVEYDQNDLIRRGKETPKEKHPKGSLSPQDSGMVREDSTGGQAAGRARSIWLQGPEQQRV